MWSSEKIRKHVEAAKLINEIKDRAFEFILKSKSCSEWDVQQHIMGLFQKANLVTDHEQIVAFGENTSFVHYFPSQYSKKIGKNMPIMIDLWARLNESDAPFADITWMAFKGTPSSEFMTVFNLVLKARDSGLKFTGECLKKGKIPSGKEIDSSVRDLIKKEGFEKNFMHSTGHSLGMTSAHGNLARISQKNLQPIKIQVPYTIEPGIYLKGKFGARSEIDFLVSKAKKVFLTSCMQKKLVFI